jgi:ankyrin repeat protein
MNLNVKNLDGDGPLAAAVRRSRLPIVETLIDTQPECVNERVRMGRTPLMIAAEYGFLDIAEFLLKSGTDQYAVDQDGRNAKQIAMASPGSMAVAMLLGAPASDVGGDPSVNVIKSRNRNELRRLIDAGKFDSQARDHTGKTVITAAVAITNPDIDMVDDILQAGADINEQGADGDNPILTVARQKDPRTVKALLERGANSNVQDREGNTPVLNAARNGDIESLEMLIQHKARVGVRNHKGETALIVAAQQGHTEMVRILLSAQPRLDIDACDIYGRTALMAAILEGYDSIAGILRQAGATKGEKEARLILGSGRGDLDEVLSLIQAGADINARGQGGRSALLDSSRQGHAMVVKTLLAGGKHSHADVNAADSLGWTALMLAAREGHEDVLHLLIDQQADVNLRRGDGTTALMDACRHGHSGIADALIEANAEVDAARTDGRTALHLAVENGHLNIVDLLLQHNAPVDAAARYGATPLMIAILKGASQIEQLLWDHGATKGAQEAELFVATASGDLERIRSLIADGVNVNAPVMFGRMPLTAAVSRGYLEIVQLLVDAGANIEVRAPQQFTALEQAARYGRRAIAAYLLRRGAVVNARGKDGSTPLILACEKGRTRTVSTLIARGADVNAVDDNGCKEPTQSNRRQIDLARCED